MFSTRGLFNSLACPDKDCTRNPCPFSHAAPSSLPPPSVVVVPDTVPTLPAERPVWKPSPPSAVPSKRPANNVSQSSSEPPRKVQRVVNGSVSTASSSTSIAAVQAGPPTLRVNAAMSTVAVPVRQAMLKTLYDHFKELYVHILDKDPGLASEHALAQELDVYGRTNKMTYRNAIIMSVASLKKRPKPDSISHPSVGTERMIAERAAAVSAVQNLKLTKKHVETIILSMEDLKLWDYVVEVPAEPGGTKPSEEGNEMQCERCRKPFIVKRKEEADECIYHWGRSFTSKAGGERTRIYKCCSQAHGATGCTSGPHVFYEKDTLALHARHPFSLTSSTGKSEPLEVAAVDCEMIYTTGGMRVARVSVVDGKGEQVFDELVKMDDGVEVIDYNTRFSGIKSLDDAVLDLAAVRKALSAFVGPETVLIGHSLDSDLKTLRMVHVNVVDTGVLFPHRSGHPYRYALRDLVRERLGQTIQAGGADVGHSSVEDARATLDLVRWWALERAKEAKLTAGRTPKSKPVE